MLSVVHFLLVICRCKCWVINCRRADLDKKSAADLNKCYFVCGHHFEESQFLNDLRNRLVWKAVPTLFKIQDVSTYNFATSWSNVTKLYLCSQVHVMEEQFREKCPELCVGKSIAQKLYEHMYPALDFTFIFVSHPEHALYLSQKITKLYIVMRLFYAVKFRNRDITTRKLDKKRKNAHGSETL